MVQDAGLINPLWGFDSLTPYFSFLEDFTLGKEVQDVKSIG